MAKAKLATGPPSQNHAGPLAKGGWTDKSMRALVLAIIVAYSVLATILFYITITENSDSLAADDDSFRLRLVVWSAVGGIAALAFGIACLRFGLFRTLSLVIASGFFVFVIGYSSSEIVLCRSRSHRGTLSCYCSSSELWHGACGTRLRIRRRTDRQGARSGQLHSSRQG